MQTFSNELKYCKGTSRHKFLRRWWLRSRICRKQTTQLAKQLNLEQKMIVVKPEDFAIWEFFVPWWAWPLELIHRAIFGKVILNKLEEV